MVVGVAHDSVRSMRNLKFCGYPMIADVKRKIVVDYKTFMLKPNIVDKTMGHSKVSRPITFLINNEGIIVWKEKSGAIRRPKPKKLFQAIDQHL